ncbi:hypothetical protein AB0885_38940, partial [Streptomyces sp. NPDC005534]|uniref:hypothetical protein n=1 Tax=Streptomyces sp. NPDC005534 TaxID=3155714 RepID=UPI003456CCC3
MSSPPNPAPVRWADTDFSGALKCGPWSLHHNINPTGTDPTHLWNTTPATVPTTETRSVASRPPPSGTSTIPAPA